jgi:hypothetical protein
MQAQREVEEEGEEEEDVGVALQRSTARYRSPITR